MADWGITRTAFERFSKLIGAAKRFSLGLVCAELSQVKNLI